MPSSSQRLSTAEWLVKAHLECFSRGLGSILILILLSAFALSMPREARQAGRVNPAGAAHKDVRRFRRRRMRLTEIPGLQIPGLLADPTAPSLGAPLEPAPYSIRGRLSFGYLSLPFTAPQERRERRSRPEGRSAGCPESQKVTPSQGCEGSSQGRESVFVTTPNAKEEADGFRLPPE